MKNKLTRCAAIILVVLLFISIMPAANADTNLNGLTVDTGTESSNNETDEKELPANEPSYLLLIVFGITALVTAASVILFMIVKKKRQIT